MTSVVISAEAAAAAPRAMSKPFVEEVAQPDVPAMSNTVNPAAEHLSKLVLRR